MEIRVAEFSSGVLIQNWKDFFLKINISKGKWLNFENWVNGEVSKSAQFWLSKSIFYVKNHRNLSQFFFHWKISIQENIFCYWYFSITSILKSLYFLKWRPIFDTSPLTQIAKFKNFLLVCWFLGKNLSNFVYPA